MSDFVSSDEYEGEEAWKKKISGIERELFGDSSSDDEADTIPQRQPDEEERTDEKDEKDEKKDDSLVEEDQPVIRVRLGMSTEEFEQAPQKQEEQSQPTNLPRLRRHPAKQAKTQHQEPEPELDESTRKILEARQEFEAALIRVRAKRAPSHSVLDGEGESVGFDDMVIRMKQQMMAASQADDQASLLRQPATAKLRLLPQVISMLAKYAMAKEDDVFICVCIAGSVSPMSFSTTTSSKRCDSGSNRWPVAFFLPRPCAFRSSAPFAWYGDH